MKRAPTASVSPTLRRFIELADQLGFSLGRVAREAGIDTNVVYRWNTGAAPTLYLFEAALNALGYKLKIVRIDDD